MPPNLALGLQHPLGFPGMAMGLQQLPIAVPKVETPEPRIYLKTEVSIIHYNGGHDVMGVEIFLIFLSLIFSK